VALNIRKFIQGIGLIPKSSTTIDAAGEMEVLTANNKINYHNGSSASPVVTEVHASQGANRLKNKDLDDATLAIVDTSDTTKKILFDAAGTTGTTTTLLSSQTSNRIITLPDVTGTLLTNASADVLTNKKLDDTSVYYVDTGDNTKELHFDCVGTTGTKTTLTTSQTSNRIITLPDATTTLVGTDTADILTNKLQINVDNIRLDGNTISSTDSNGNIILSPNGTGDVLVDGIIVSESAISDVSGITGLAGGALAISSASGQNLTLSGAGAGNVIISGTNTQIQTVIFTTNTITGASGSNLAITGGASRDLVLNGGSGAGVLINSTALTIAQGLRATRVDDATTTGADATLTAFTSGFIKLTNSSLESLSAIPAGVNGQQLILSNGTGNSILINNEDTGVTAANRILTGTGNFLTIDNDATVNLIYDTGASRWKVYGGAGGGGSSTVFGTRGSPIAIQAADGFSEAEGNFSSTSFEQVVFVEGDGGPITITANPAIESGTIVGQKMIIIGRSLGNTVTLVNDGADVELNGDVTLSESDIITLIWDGTAWVESSRS